MNPTIATVPSILLKMHIHTPKYCVDVVFQATCRATLIEFFSSQPVVIMYADLSP